MTRTLDIYFHEDLVGHLVQDGGGKMVFGYVESWLNKPGAMPISQSLPLRTKRFGRNECRGYFAGILPEASKRDVIARNLGVSARNDYAMLERIGGECAGAITFVPHGQALPEPNYGYRKLSPEELGGILRELPRRPLLAGDAGIRLSLAGAQDKVAVRMEHGEVCLPLGGAPSTHILKPAVDRFEGIVFNEALCMKLAARAGLPTASVEAIRVDGVDCLTVERYDRIHTPGPSGEPVLKRIHQEDFCQALGVVPEHKYQREGGPSLKRCFALLREVSTAPVIDLARLLEASIYNYLVGNNDAHAKNFSLIYRSSGAESPEIGLAPLYDIVSTLYYPELTRDMAMRIGDEYSSEKVTARNFEKLAEEAGLGKPLVRARVRQMAERVIDALETMDLTNSDAEKVSALIRQRSESVRNSFRI